MNVNVELLTTDKSRLFKIIQTIGTIFLGIAILLLIARRPNFALIIIMYISLCIALILGVVLSFYHGGLKSIGKLTFTESSLIIYKEGNPIQIPLKDLINMKIAIKEYNGEPNIPTAIINPSKKGTENFIWIDASNKKDKFRFKLISLNHMNRLSDRIEEWRRSNPSIKVC